MPRARFPRSAGHRPCPAGTTLVELVVAFAMVALLTTIAAPRVQALLDAARVGGAATEVSAAFGAARELALLRGGLTAVTLDPAAGTVAVHDGTDSTHVRRLRALYGVSLHTTRDSMAYAATGLGYGASNLRVIVTRGAARETITVSRLGRVRRSRR